MKPDGELCADYEIIGNLEECKSAITELGNHGIDIVFLNAESYDFVPKGCYKYSSSKQAFWNTHSLGAAAADCQPICKKGK